MEEAFEEQNKLPEFKLGKRKRTLAFFRSVLPAIRFFAVSVGERDGNVTVTLDWSV